MLGEKLSHTWFNRSSIKKIRKNNVKLKYTGKDILIVLKINLNLSNILNKIEKS